MAVPFPFEVGHTVVLTDDYGEESHFYVRELRADGWMFEPYAREGERHFHSGEAIRRSYLAGLMKYLPWDDDVIPEARRRRWREEFRAQPRAARLAAVRRLTIVRACERSLAMGEAKGAVLGSVPAAVVAERGTEWLREDTEEAKKLFKDREKRGLLKPGEYFVPPLPMNAPCERTAWEWMKRYLMSGRSVNSLLPDHKSKGRRESQLTKVQDEVISTYLTDHVKYDAGFDQAAAYKAVSRILKGRGESAVSRKAFDRRVKRQHDKKGMARLVQGRRAARRTGHVSSMTTAPLWPLHQVEGDHTLLNIKVLDDETGIDLGRPWLSVLKDRLFGIPTGLHLSHLAPSWATCSRAIAHSMWPKDLSGYPSVAGGWNCEGVFDEFYTDRGMDFISDAGREAAARMKFEILNLPGYHPWLKGSLENWNKQVKAEIMTYRDGITSFNNPEYRGKNHPTVKLSELKTGLLEWLVDDFMEGEHPRYKGLSYREVQEAALAEHGPPRPVEDFEEFRRLTMIPMMRTIQNYGVEVDGYFFRDQNGALEDLRKDHNAPRDYLVLIDPWNMGYIELLAGTTWLVLLNQIPEAIGISRFKSEFYWNHAAEANPGKRLSIDDFLRAREVVDADAERVLKLGSKLKGRGSQNVLGRFRDLGEFITPVPLRSVVFKEAPVSIPGWTEVDGILRPEGRAVPGTPGVVVPKHPAAPNASEAGPARFRKTDQPVSGAASPAVPGFAMFERLAAAGEARAQELGA